MGPFTAHDPSIPTPAGGDADYWQGLGLEPGADPPTIKRAFRAQARRWHPDLNGNDPVAEDRFKLVNEAYAVLSDPSRRRAWEAGEDVVVSGDGWSGADPLASGFPDFEDYLSILFDRPVAERPAETDRAGEVTDSASEWAEPSTPGDSPSQVATTPVSPPPVQAGGDLETLVSLTPEEALGGTRLELELGDGTAVEVWTPALCGDGWRLRLGGVGPGGGDHFLQLRVRTPEGLRIDGLRVHHMLELHPADAALGCQVVVPTLGGPVRLRVPPGSSSGRLLRLRGRGQRWDDRVGDQIVEIRIVIPDPLSDAELALFRRLRELDDEQRRDGADPSRRDG